MIDSIANNVVSDLWPPEGAANMPHDQMVARAYGHPLPARREWQGLTEEEVFNLAAPFGAFEYGDAQGHKRLAFANAVETKLKEKNT